MKNIFEPTSGLFDQTPGAFAPSKKVSDSTIVEEEEDDEQSEEEDDEQSEEEDDEQSEED